MSELDFVFKVQYFVHQGYFYIIKFLEMMFQVSQNDLDLATKLTLTLNLWSHLPTAGIRGVN